jgi:hypothetical protein
LKAEENTSIMKINNRLQAGTILALLLLLIPVRTSAQCELLKRDIEDVRSYAMEMLKISDTLEVFANNVSGTQKYQTARSNARKAQIYSGEILAATYQVVLTAAEAQQRAEACGIEGVSGFLSDAGSHATKARDLAEQAFAYAKRAYGSRSLATMQSHLQKSMNAVREARKAAGSVAYAASDAHFCCSPEDLAAAGKG